MVSSGHAVCDLRVVDEHPGSQRAQRALTAYAIEVVHAAGLERLDVRTTIQDVDGFQRPDGAFLVAVTSGDVVGCIGLRRFAEHQGEIKRMWVSPTTRRLGIGARLLEAIERRAVALGYARVLLDTNGALTAATGFYAAHGYTAIPRYNDNPDATHFFAKDVIGRG